MHEFSIITVGELLVEFVSHRKGCSLRALGEYSGPYPSGAPAIFIDQAARLGAHTQIFGGLGADNFGTALIDRLQSNGVETNSVLRLEHKTTGVAFVSYFEDGDRTFIFHLDNTAADALEVDDVELPNEPILLHVSGSSLGNPKLRHVIEHTANQVIDRGGKLSLDPNARAELMRDDDARSVLQTMMQKSAYLFPSTSDLEFLYPDKSQTDAVDALLSVGAETVALKRGAEGATIFANGEAITLKGHAVQEVDPTGAGDCFCGTYLAMVMQGHSPEAAGRLANAAGALAVTQRGPMEGNSDLATIEQFLAANDAD